jgi:four helix bundle protein
MNKEIKSYKDLDVWKNAIDFAKNIYFITQDFPNNEKYGLISQMRRAAVSIPSNIAEGHARSSTSEFMHFISICQGSIAELGTQLILSNELSIINDDIKEQLLSDLDKIGKMLRGLYKALKDKRLRE